MNAPIAMTRHFGPRLLLAILGATVGASGSSAQTLLSGIQNATSLIGDLEVASNTSATLTGGTTLTGGNVTLGASAGLYWQQSGTVNATALSFALESFFYVSEATGSLTLDSASSATGQVRIYSLEGSTTAISNLGTITHTTGDGFMLAGTLTNEGTITATGGAFQFGSVESGYDSINHSSGVITADAATVFIRGNVINNGLLVAENAGSLVFDGSNTTANLGDIQLLTGGFARLKGTLDNTSATLSAPTGGMFELYGGTIQGGTIAEGALGLTSLGGYLDGVVLTGDLELPAISTVGLAGGTVFTGAEANLGAGSMLFWQQTGTLEGKSLTFAESSQITLVGTGRYLALDELTTATGAVQIAAGVGEGNTIVNQGAITHTGSSGYLYAPAFTNEGSITATGGTLHLGDARTGFAFTNASSGTIAIAPNGHVSVVGPLTNLGTLSLSGGTLTTGNQLLVGAGGSLTGSGTIHNNLTLAGGTLAPGGPVGTITFSNGGLSVTAASTLHIQVDGAVSGTLLFQDSGALIDIGSGLLELSVSLLSAPAPETTYTFMSVAAGGTGLLGTFAGLPVSGGLLETGLLGQDYHVTVNYLGNAITMDFQAVPEPETYALMLTGIALLAWRRRRRRAEISGVRHRDH